MKSECHAEILFLLINQCYIIQPFSNSLRVLYCLRNMKRLLKIFQCFVILGPGIINRANVGYAYSYFRAVTYLPGNFDRLVCIVECFVIHTLFIICQAETML